MRSLLVALALSALPGLVAHAGELRHFEDAALYAIQFVDEQEGWAAGDEGSMYPFVTGRGFELKAQLIRASIQAMEAIWDILPAARFLLRLRGVPINPISVAPM